jgi:hypothetical protein
MEVLEDHKRQVSAGVLVHVNLATVLKEVRQRGRLGATSSGTGVARSRSVRVQATTLLFFNYNTVESVLLACAVLVNLAGILFESTSSASKKKTFQVCALHCRLALCDPLPCLAVRVLRPRCAHDSESEAYWHVSGGHWSATFNQRCLCRFRAL